MADDFPRLVSLACHDLRTPLATVFGFARTLTRSGELDERTARFVGMIEEASTQMASMLDDLSTAARIEAGRWEPTRGEVDTLELVRSDEGRVAVSGIGVVVETDVEAVSRAFDALALAAVRYGPVDQVAWSVDGRLLELSPVTSAAGPVVIGIETRDLGALVGLRVLAQLEATVELDGGTLRVAL